MKHNVIILTSGMSGSSVLAGVISQSGYWLGKATSRAPFDTYENIRLIELNQKILRQAGYFWKDVADIPPPSTQKIKALQEDIDLTEFNYFIDECIQHKPFLWKDPRLSYTIYFWEKLLDLSTFKFFLMTRDLKQSWIGGVLRAKRAISLENQKNIENNCTNQALRFFNEHKLDYCHVTFEDLISNPQNTLAKINRFIDEKLTIDDIQKIYKGSLYSIRWNEIDYLKARLRFLYYRYIAKEEILFPRLERIVKNG